MKKSLHHPVMGNIAAFYLFGMFLLAMTIPSSAQTLQWKTLGNLREARNYFEAQPISDHEALVIGGYVNGTHPLNGAPSKSCELIDLNLRLILPAAQMSVAHAETVSLLAADSTIVIVSGMSGNGVLTALCEAYSPKTRSWRVLGELLLPRRQHTAVFINRDEILVVGGRIGNNDVVGNCEIFNVRTGKSRLTGTLPTGVCIGASGIASNGDILVIGGNGRGFGAQHSRGVYAFDRVSETWSLASILPENLAATTLMTMPNGELTLFYGHNGDDARGWLASNTVYRENASTFRAVATSPTPRYWTCAAAWNQDSVLVVGGFESASFSPAALATTEWFDTRTNTLSAGPMLNVQRTYAKSLSFTRLDACSGEAIPRIIAISGFDSWSSATPSVEVLERQQAVSWLPFASMTAYPVPTADVVNIAIRSPKIIAGTDRTSNGGEYRSEYRYTLANAMGYIVAEGALRLAPQGSEQNRLFGKVDVREVPTGVYFLRVADVSPCGTVPVIVRR
jgi:hypothetical protein